VEWLFHPAGNQGASRKQAAPMFSYFLRLLPANAAITSNAIRITLSTSNTLIVISFRPTAHRHFTVHNGKSQSRFAERADNEGREAVLWK
jgi:hypothetical protein